MGRGSAIVESRQQREADGRLAAAEAEARADAAIIIGVALEEQREARKLEEEERYKMVGRAEAIGEGRLKLGSRTVSVT